MRVLLIGSGAREHALGWKLAQSPKVTELISLPGNPGLAELGPTIEGVDPHDVGAIAAIARIHDVDFVVVGPEGPLARGAVDALTRVGIPTFGPTRAAARLESSKSYAKEIMQRAGVATPPAWTFDRLPDALKHIRQHPGPYVVKADGLAGGKGVLVTESTTDASAWAEQWMNPDASADPARLVIEEFMSGPELSVFAICDGTRSVMFPPARDYKRVGDGDTGPNTGGMGSYSPVDVPGGLIDDVQQTVIQPVLDTMRADGHPYVGVLYAGLVLTTAGPTVIEFNCRFGDPEIQVVLPRLQSDLMDVLEAAVAGRLDGVTLEWSETTVVNVVMATQGYPAHPRTGDVISGLDECDALVFQASTTRDGKHLRTDGGRVLSVLGTGPDIESARNAAYASVESIRFKGEMFRRDIAGPKT